RRIRDPQSRAGNAARCVRCSASIATDRRRVSWLASGSKLERVTAQLRRFLRKESARPAPIHESRLRLGYLLKARRSAGRWWSSDKADWKSQPSVELEPCRSVHTALEESIERKLREAEIPGCEVEF